ncbi:MAG: hypothetical protein QXE79_05115, partial [Candidatus Bathyarchaeia archaeon]
MVQKKAVISVENVVASATLDQDIDLGAVVRRFPSVEYKPEQFPGLVYRLKRPKTATLIFSSGKMVCLFGYVYRKVRTLVPLVFAHGLWNSCVS